ncbi:MAG TPA: TIGR03118 family protein [Pirellulales bacterium]|nr:TIGR03118 family protein [Pirellulales bacterium]
MNGRLYVAYAKQDAAGQNPVPGVGAGVVAVFDSNGNFQTQLVGAGANSPLDAPYGMAIAPSGFAGLGGDLLVANSGDGRINAFDPATGAFLGALNNTQGQAVAIDGLRSLAFGDGVSGDSNALYFTADPAGGQHGLFGKLVDAQSSPLTVVGTNISATEGAAFNGVAAALSDSDPNAQASAFTINIDWGDGTASPGSLAANGSGGFNVLGAHTYAEDAATRRLSIAVADPSGHAATVLSQASVAENDLAVSGATIAATEGAAHGFSGAVATFADPGASDAASAYAASVDWGDGSISAGSIISSGGRFTVLSNHVYADEGTFTVSVSVSETGVNPAVAGSSVTTAVVADADEMTSSGATLSGATLSGVEGQTVSGAVATFIDAGNPSAAAGDFTAAIDWGDGTSAAPGSLSGSDGTFNVSGSHAYAEHDGPYSISVTLSEDGPDPASWTAAGAAAISDADRFAGAALSINATEGRAFSGVSVATFTDSNLATTAADLTAAIDWGDGTSGAGQVSGSNGNFTVAGSHAYADDGAYAIAVRLSEAAPGTAAGAVASTARVAEADFSATSQTLSETEGAAATLTQVFSDPDSVDLPSDLTALVSWGDGANASSASIRGSGGQFTITAQHRYADEGEFSGQIAIIEGVGSSAVAVGAIPLAAQVADADTLTTTPATLSAAEGVSAALAVATFTDSNAAASAADFTAAIDWGDGSSASAGSITLADGVFTVSGSHAFADEGTFHVSISLAEDSGPASGSATSTATVADSDVLSPEGHSLAATEGLTFSGAVATFADSNASAVAGDFTATIDWGDGTSATAGVVTGGSGLFTVSGSHAYSQPGSQPIKTTLTEKSPGNAVATAIANATVAASTLSLVGVPVVATQGTLAANVTVARFSGSPGGSGANQFAASIDWGDGSTSAGTVAASASGNGFTVTGSHAYQGAGMRDIEVTVHGPGGVVQQVAETATVGSATEIFVSQAYRNLLHREPETQGLQYWSQQIDGGGSRTAAVLGIERSGEYRLAEIQGLYQRYLHREADASGLAADEAFLSDGGTSEQLAAAIVSSAEYFRRRGGGTNHGFLQALYADTLFRAPDQAAVQSYAEQDFRVETAPVQAVDAVFSGQEFYRDLVSAPGSAASSRFAGWVAYGWYQAFLSRNPESASASYYASALADGKRDESVIAAIIGSQEYSGASLTRVDSLQP